MRPISAVLVALLLAQGWIGVQCRGGGRGGGGNRGGRGGGGRRGGSGLKRSRWSPDSSRISFPIYSHSSFFDQRGIEETSDEEMVDNNEMIRRLSEILFPDFHRRYRGHGKDETTETPITTESTPTSDWIQPSYGTEEPSAGGTIGGVHFEEGGGCSQVDPGNKEPTNSMDMLGNPQPQSSDHLQIDAMIASQRGSGHLGIEGTTVASATLQQQGSRHFEINAETLQPESAHQIGKADDIRMQRQQFYSQLEKIVSMGRFMQDKHF